MYYELTIESPIEFTRGLNEYFQSLEIECLIDILKTLEHHEISHISKRLEVKLTLEHHKEFPTLKFESTHEFDNVLEDDIEFKNELESEITASILDILNALDYNSYSKLE